MIATLITALYPVLGTCVVVCLGFITKHIVKLAPEIKEIAPELKLLITELRKLITSKLGITPVQIDSAVKTVEVEAVKDIPVIEEAISPDLAAKVAAIEAILATLPTSTVTPAVVVPVVAPITPTPVG